MKLSIATACAAFAISLAGSAFADVRVTATLESAGSAPKQLIAAHSVWNCASDSCSTNEAADEVASLDGCKDLAKQVGRVSEYKGFRALDAKALAKCNAVAVTPSAKATASR